MPASSANITPVVIMRTAVCIAVRRHKPDAVEQGSQVADIERAPLHHRGRHRRARAWRLSRRPAPALPRIRRRACGRSPDQIGVVSSNRSSRRSADLAAPEGTCGRPQSIRPATRKYPCSSTVSPAVSGTMVCSQSAVASETCAPLISPNDPRISVAPFRTSRPRIRAEVLELIL